jgi:hypothetical protein
VGLDRLEGGGKDLADLGAGSTLLRLVEDLPPPVAEARQEDHADCGDIHAGRGLPGGTRLRTRRWPGSWIR